MEDALQLGSGEKGKHTPSLVGWQRGKLLPPRFASNLVHSSGLQLSGLSGGVREVLWVAAILCRPVCHFVFVPDPVFLPPPYIHWLLLVSGVCGVWVGECV